MGSNKEQSSYVAISAFNRTISQYQELAIASGQLQATVYSQSAESGKADHTGSSANIKASKSDFIADVETNAWRCLNTSEFEYWKRHYKSTEVVVLTREDILETGFDSCFQMHLDTFHEEDRAEIIALDLSMRTKLGNRLISVGLYPSSDYFKAVDLRTTKPKKLRWSHLYGN